MTDSTSSIAEPVTELRTDAPKPVPELAVSHWWRFADLRTPLTASDGRQISVVFRGVWSHGMGPDFREAMIAFASGELHSGSIEIHRQASDWYNHGHHRDAAYNDVVLHVVLINDSEETRRLDGKVVPVVVLAGGIEFADGPQVESWSMVGGDVCAAHLVSTHRDDLRAIVLNLGDRRLGGKSARLEAQLAGRHPGEVLFTELLEGLGYSANREPMRQLAGMAPLQAIEMLMSTAAAEHRALLAIAALLGAAGFLPLSPQIQETAGLTQEDVARIEALWVTRCGAWHQMQIAPTRWNLARMRPANHPARRLVAAGTMLAFVEGGLLFNAIEAIRAGAGIDTLLSEWSSWHGERLVGEGRARAIAANAIVPFAMALAAHDEDDELALAASRLWESLPGEEPNQATRRAARQIAGNASLGPWGARGMQGLVHLDSTLCAPRRCFECPIAHLVLSSEPEDDQGDAILPKLSL